MGKFTQLLDVFSNHDGRELTDSELESLEAEILSLKRQRDTAIGICSTLLRGIHLNATQQADAAALLTAAQADYNELLRNL